ncbi:MAG: peptidoglycan-binding domain-containing protein [Candidatus Omnitrophota bacterium]
MLKTVFFLACIFGVTFLAGCEQKVKEPENILNAEQAIEENELLEPDDADIQGAGIVETDSTTSPSAGMDLQGTANVAGGSGGAAFVKPEIQQIQQALKQAGAYQGKIDGVSGPKTKRAIKDFQSQNGLNPDGKVGPKTWEKLRTYLNPVAENISGAPSN